MGPLRASGQGFGSHPTRHATGTMANSLQVSRRAVTATVGRRSLSTDQLGSFRVSANRFVRLVGLIWAELDGGPQPA